MVRKLALAVSLALGTLSVPAHALGLGELESKSALNQNFIGDIRLLSVGPEDLDAVRVQLADAEAFGRAGIERPFYLSLLRFEPTVSGTGRPVIRVTSDFPIREPFLNFLIEIDWPQRMVQPGEMQYFRAQVVAVAGEKTLVEVKVAEGPVAKTGAGKAFWAVVLAKTTAIRPPPPAPPVLPPTTVPPLASIAPFVAANVSQVM